MYDGFNDDYFPLSSPAVKLGLFCGAEGGSCFCGCRGCRYLVKTTSEHNVGDPRKDLYRDHTMPGTQILSNPFLPKKSSQLFSKKEVALHQSRHMGKEEQRKQKGAPSLGKGRGLRKLSEAMSWASSHSPRQLVNLHRVGLVGARVVGADLVGKAQAVMHRVRTHERVVCHESLQVGGAAAWAQVCSRGVCSG